MASPCLPGNKHKGPNHSGIGAVKRAGNAERLGLAKEVHAGSGHGSQDSAAQVPRGELPPMRVCARWPGGQVSTADVPAEAKEVTRRR